MKPRVQCKTKLCSYYLNYNQENGNEAWIEEVCKIS